jgi:hypothetical protein
MVKPVCVLLDPHYAHIVARCHRRVGQSGTEETVACSPEDQGRHGDAPERRRPSMCRVSVARPQISAITRVVALPAGRGTATTG